MAVVARVLVSPADQPTTTHPGWPSMPSFGPRVAHRWIMAHLISPSRGGFEIVRSGRTDGAVLAYWEATSDQSNRSGAGLDSDQPMSTTPPGLCSPLSPIIPRRAYSGMSEAAL